jgi:putative transposase
VPEFKRNLPRLEKHHYQGHAVVFWTLTLEERARGWLTRDFHNIYRELMVHAAHRESLFCPAYCLMPDHLHFIWMGMRPESDQLNAMKFLRTQLEPSLGDARKWQHQPHDHVLREKERMRNAFSTFCFYILANPVRANFVKDEKDWAFSGAIVPGYPAIHPLDNGFWELFWKLYAAIRRGPTHERPPT